MARFGGTPTKAALFRGPLSTESRREFPGTSKIIQKKPSPVQTEIAGVDTSDTEWLNQLRETEPELYQIYQEKGYTALTKAIEDMTAEQQATLSKLDPYKTDQGYDIATAIADNKVTAQELTKWEIFKEDDVAKATEAARELTERRKIEPKLDQYKSDTGYNISQALTDQAITTDELKTLGFKDEDVDRAVTYNTTIAKLGDYKTQGEATKVTAKLTGKDNATPKNKGKLRDYKVDGQYDLVAALASGELTQADLKGMGFASDTVGEAADIAATLGKLKPYKADGKYDLDKVLKEEIVSREDLGKAGLTQGYNIVQALVDEAITVTGLGTLGFGEDTISQAQKGAADYKRYQDVTSTIDSYKGQRKIKGYEDQVVAAMKAGKVTENDLRFIFGLDDTNEWGSDVNKNDTLAFILQIQAKADPNSDAAKAIAEAKEQIRKARKDWGNKPITGKTLAQWDEGYYPKWSEQYQRAKAALASKSYAPAKVWVPELGEAVSVGNLANIMKDPEKVEKYGLEKYKPFLPTGDKDKAPKAPVTMTLAQGAGMAQAYHEAYLASQKYGGNIPVEVAKQIIKDARATTEKVEKQTTIVSIEPETAVGQQKLDIPLTQVEKNKLAETQEAAACQADANKCIARVYKVSGRDADGKWVSIYVEETNEGNAEDKAEAYGLTKISSVSFQSSFGKPTTTEIGNYIATYADGHTVTMVEFVDPESNDPLLLPKDYADQLKDTDFYKNATGTDSEKLGAAYVASQKEYKDWQEATETLNKAGLTDPNEFTIPVLAKFIRDNEGGAQTLKDAGFDPEVVQACNRFNQQAERIINDIDTKLDTTKLTLGEKLALARTLETVDPRSFRIEGLNEVLGGSAHVYETPIKLSEGVPEASTALAGPLQRTWDKLTPDEKVAVAFLYDQDYTKGNSFSSVTQDLGFVMQRGPAETLVFAIPQAILSPIGKQVNIDAAREAMDKQFKAERDLFKSYVIKKDGYETFDVEKIKAKMDSTPSYAERALEETGYENQEALLANLDYHNYAVHVTPKEWAIAGIVGALTALPFVGSATAGTVRQVATSALGNALPVTLGALTLPDTIKLVKSPEAPKWLKGMSIGATALMFSPLLGPAIRGVQFARTAARNDYVPMRSLATERATMRVPFTEAQVARMTKAGLTTADILDRGTQIVKQMMQGVKVATVNFPGGKIKVTNAQYQRLIGRASFHSTPDGTLIIRGTTNTPIIKEMYATGKVGIDPLEQAYVSGLRGGKPTIIEIRGDPEVMARLFPQQKLLGRGIEPEQVIPSLDQLQGMGYQIEPIPGAKGHGTTFDATLGKVDIYRVTLSKVTGQPTGLVQTVLGKTGDGGVVALGDFHGTTKYSTIFKEINKGFGEPLVKGDPKNPSTWEWIPSKNKGRSVVLMGDLIDRGPAYGVLRNTFNRLHDQAAVAGDNVVRLLGNHELAYISGDVIKGGTRGFPEVIPDTVRAQIKQNIISDINKGYVKAAYAKDNALFTHAGISKGVYGRLVGKSPKTIADALQGELAKSVKADKWTSATYAKGRVEKGNSLSTNERAQGGIYWLRPQEAKAGELDWGFTQVVGHNPGWKVRAGQFDANFIQTDVGTIHTGKVGSYVDTPYITTKQVSILTQKLPGEAPQITPRIQGRLMLSAMRDTVADFFMGWDGRIQAIRRIKENSEAVKAYIKEINAEIAIRRKAGDTKGIELLERMKHEMTSPEGKDYLYGGIGFWRDIVMGRQNSVKVLDTIPKMKPGQLKTFLSNLNTQAGQIKLLSNTDLQRMFGMNKEQVTRALDMSKAKTNAEALARARSYIDTVDRGLERSVLPYLDGERVAAEYAKRLRSYYETQNRRADYAPAEFDERYYKEQEERRNQIQREINRELTERVEQYYQQTPKAREEYAPRAVEAPRAPRQPRQPRAARAERVTRLTRVPEPPYAPYPPYPPRPPTPTTTTGMPTTTKKVAAIKLGKKDERPEYPPGTIVWKQGETGKGPEYKIIPPGYTLLKPISSTRPPKGMRRTKGTPQETLTFIGGKVPFDNVSFDLGVTDGFIDVKAKKIRFTGEGEKTNVGTRLQSTTTGIALKRTPATNLKIESVLARGKPKGRLVSHGVYADKGTRRITRKRRRGWKRIY